MSDATCYIEAHQTGPHALGGAPSGEAEAEVRIMPLILLSVSQQAQSQVWSALTYPHLGILL